MSALLLTPHSPPQRLLIPAILITWALILPRTIPNLAFDHGIFASVAERVLAGDKLYSGVWDNKDPLFYWILALGRLISPLADIGLELTWLAIACVAMRAIVGTVVHSKRLPAVAGFVVTPIVLTGGVYLPGHTHLPAIAVGLLCLAAAASRRWGWAGLLIGSTIGLKLVMFPVLALALGVALVAQFDRAALMRIALGAISAVSGLLAVLVFRGELLPYLHTQWLNVAYSQVDLLDPALPSPLAHLTRVATLDSMVSASASTVVIATSARFALRSPSPLRTLWWETFVTFFGAILILALTGIWQQHAQILLLPATLAGALVVVRLQNRQSGPSSRRGLRAAPGLSAAVIAALALGGPQAAGYVQALQDAPTRIRQLVTLSPEATALIRSGPPSSYARVGSNDDGGHAFGLRAWRLACANFAQYDFDPVAQLSKDASCLRRAEVVLVASSARPVPGRPAWNNYLAEVHEILNKSFVCSEALSVEVCRHT